MGIVIVGRPWILRVGVGCATCTKPYRKCIDCLQNHMTRSHRPSLKSATGKPTDTPQAPPPDRRTSPAGKVRRHVACSKGARPLTIWVVAVSASWLRFIEFIHSEAAFVASWTPELISWAGDCPMPRDVVRTYIYFATR